MSQSSRPAILADFKQGDTPYQIDHLCATLNWLVSYIDNLRGEKASEVANRTDNQLYIKIDDSSLGTPKLKIKGSAGQKFKSGSDSNVVISSKPDSQGYYTIDVYYK